MILYPPLVKSSLPSFSADTEEIKFYYNLPNTMGSAAGLSLYYIIVNQNNNQSVLKDSNTMQNGSELAQIQQDENGLYFIIKQSSIIGGWTAGNIYKVQLRFYNKLDDVYSEWSSVCYLKATSYSNDITVEIINAENSGATVYVESPRFFGYVNIPDETEIQTKYKFDLYEYSSGELIETTGWKLHIASENDSVVFSQLLNNFSRYYLYYSIQTNNGYEKTVRYSFLCSFNLLENPQLSINGEPDFEEGYIKLHIQSQESIATNLILRRTDSRSNFIKWEDYKIFNILDEKADIYFNDYLIEHGIEYKYGIQILSKEGYRGDLIQSNIIYATYEHMYLVGNDKQLKIKFNPKVSSWKRTLQETKIDTIGSKYPFIARNGNVNYFTFPINGLISYHVDEKETFCSKNSLCVSNQITTDSEFNVNLDSSNIVLEREFRNQVEEFLTNGDYKYFKSPTEGIKLIAITGVSLTPEDTLGRMIYSFTSTAYEVGPANLTNVLDLGIRNAGEYTEVKDMGDKEIGGILPSFRVSSPYEDIYAKIKSAVEVEINNTYKRKLKYIKNLKIEITNPQIILSSGYKISIQQEPNGSFQEFIISKELAYYELNDIIKIYGLKASLTNAQMNVSYVAVCNYEEIEQEGAETGNYVAISKFDQLYNTFSESRGNVDILQGFKQQNSSVVRILNLTYLRVDAMPGTKLEINETPIVIGDSGILEYRDISITSAKFISDAVATISAIFNGVAYA